MRLSSAGSKAHDPSDPKPTTPLRQIAGNVAMTSTMGTAWYRLAAVPWSFRPDRDRESHIINQAVVAAQLTGKKIHIRGTTTPFPVRTWAEQHHNMVVEKGRPYGAGPLECWPDLLEGEQRLFLGEHQSEKEVFVGVDFLRRSIWNQSAATLAPERVGPLTRELGRQHAKLAALDTLMARAGMNGSPVTGPQMAWLLHRSSYLGFPAPAKRLTLEVDEWGAGDLADLLGEAAWAADPFATTLRVTGILNGKAITRHVAILTVGRMQHMDIPQADQPWMTLADSLGIPLEWSAHITPRADKDVLAEIRLILGKISSQTNHYEVEHEMDAPSALEEQRDLALRVEQELSGLADASLGRAKGWWRIAVSGRTETECLEHAERVIAAFGRTVEIKHTFGQYDLAREFLPGSTVKMKAHMRKLSLRAVAAAGPAVTSMAGDRRGWNIGRSSLDNSPVMFDFWRNMEDYDVSGLFPIISGLGGGKTNLLGMIVAKTGASGIPWCVIDPAGRLGRLGRTAQLRKVSRNVDLLNGAPGSLNPYALVREPQLTDFETVEPHRGGRHRSGRIGSAHRGAAHSKGVGSGSDQGRQAPPTPIPAGPEPGRSNPHQAVHGLPAAGPPSGLRGDQPGRRSRCDRTAIGRTGRCRSGRPIQGSPTAPRSDHRSTPRVQHRSPRGRTGHRRSAEVAGAGAAAVTALSRQRRRGTDQHRIRLTADLPVHQRHRVTGSRHPPGILGRRGPSGCRDP